MKCHSAQLARSSRRWKVLILYARYRGEGSQATYTKVDGHDCSGLSHDICLNEARALCHRNCISQLVQSAPLRSAIGRDVPRNLCDSSSAARGTPSLLECVTNKP